MIYKNPVISGFYPDPSVCEANGKYYVVCSSFQYFPGVPLFESEDLVNFRQIGYVLTRSSQVHLADVPSSGGVFAPTIRYHNGRFYMVTTNDTTHQNFYVYTDDIYGEWSDPIFIDQGGIDPSLLFDEGHVYFISNGADDEGNGGVVQCEIDIETGKKLTPSKSIWQGSGGRFLESPHMYHLDGGYYLMAAEGGTEYGHMITYARSDSPWGPFTGYAGNPVLTNRNKAPYIIQGIGHGDLVRDRYGEYHILSLGFRQIGEWEAYHNLGREVFLTPVYFDDRGFFTAGWDGTTDEEYEMKGDHIQRPLGEFTFENTDPGIEWCFMRRPEMDNYELSRNAFVLHGSDVTLDDIGSPTFIAMRQRAFDFELSVNVSLDGEGLGGVTMYLSENAHYDIALEEREGARRAVLRLALGGIKHLQAAVPTEGDVALKVKGDHHSYTFYMCDANGEQYLGHGLTKYISTEADGGFTGVMTGLFAEGAGAAATFTGFSIKY